MGKMEVVSDVEIVHDETKGEAEHEGKGTNKSRGKNYSSCCGQKMSLHSIQHHSLH